MMPWPCRISHPKAELSLSSAHSRGSVNLVRRLAFTEWYFDEISPPLQDQHLVFPWHNFQKLVDRVIVSERFMCHETGKKGARGAKEESSWLVVFIAFIEGVLWPMIQKLGYNMYV